MTSVYWKRLSMCGPIIRELNGATRLTLARELTRRKLETTPWTIDKIRNDIVEMFDDINYDFEKKIFIIIDTSLVRSLPEEKLEVGK